MVRTSGVDDAFSGIPETLLYDGRTSMTSAFVMSLCRWTTFQINIEISGLENIKKKGKHKLVVVIVLGWQTFILMHWIPSKRENARRVAFSGNGTLIEFNRSHPITLKKLLSYEILPNHEHCSILKYLTYWPGIISSVSARATALNIERHSTIRTLKNFDAGHS